MDLPDSDGLLLPETLLDVVVREVRLLVEVVLELLDPIEILPPLHELLYPVLLSFALGGFQLLNPIVGVFDLLAYGEVEPFLLLKYFLRSST